LARPKPVRVTPHCLQSLTPVHLQSDSKVQLALGAASKRLDRLYVFPLSDAWPFLKKNITITSGTQIKLEGITFPFVDCVRHIYDTPALTVGAGVTVGIIDSGVGPHSDLIVAGGLNTVTGETPSDFGANDVHGHGTHVAGIVAARGDAPAGNRGIAPGVTLRSYRVFGKNAEGASNFSIAKAIDAAVADGCDLLNMSLGGGPQDPVVSEAISDARAAGVVVLAANGNDSREPVSFPAAFDMCLAVARAPGSRGSVHEVYDSKRLRSVDLGFCPIKTLGFRRRGLFSSRESTLIS